MYTMHSYTHTHTLHYNNIIHTTTTTTTTTTYLIILYYYYYYYISCRAVLDECQNRRRGTTINYGIITSGRKSM